MTHLRGRFDVRVCRIDRQDDNDTISGKHSDFSNITIRTLMFNGEKDAIKSLQKWISMVIHARKAY